MNDLDADIFNFKAKGFNDTQLRELTDLKTQYNEKLCELSIKNRARSKLYCGPKGQSGVQEESV